MASKNKEYQILYIIPEANSGLVNMDPLIKQLWNESIINIIPVKNKTSNELPHLYFLIKKVIDSYKLNLYNIVIIDAFLLPKKEGVINNCKWNPSEDNMDNLLSFSCKDNTLLSLRLTSLLRRKLTNCPLLMVSTDNVEISPWNLFELSKAFNDRKYCTLYNWKDEKLLSNFRSLLKPKLLNGN
ncbi:hypothetical protein [Flavivirga rizhaonensis]|uniref:Uncharacterized protein n=1 Tax=Flavivirga rizhaonensis TaxID=2559571 RepID=A0A4S1DYP4_9FLAO|nr:hypothetical protein [Flavivirga rizhaonensis]TGV03376.1 hypothetical protein EM932_06800 [Flavivirga rizhaonensis]